MFTREAAEKVYQEWFGFDPDQEDLELWLYKSAEDLDNLMLAAKGPELDRLQFCKNEIAGLLDELAFSYTLDRATGEWEAQAVAELFETEA